MSEPLFAVHIKIMSLYYRAVSFLRVLCIIILVTSFEDFRRCFVGSQLIQVSLLASLT